MSKKNCKCGYTKYWDQEYEKIEYKFVGGERFQGRLSVNADWNASASDGGVNPSSGTGRNASTNLEPSDWQTKKDWEKKGGPKNERKVPFSTCASCKPIGKPEKIASGDPPKPGNETSGDPSNVTVTFTVVKANDPYAPSDSDSKNCKTRERKNTRIDKYKQEYTCDS